MESLIVTPFGWLPGHIYADGHFLVVLEGLFVRLIVVDAAVVEDIVDLLCQVALSLRL